MSLVVKICGLKTQSALEAAVEEGADYVGFVFFPRSPRYIEPKKAKELGALVPSNIKKVAVTVDASDQELDVIFRHFKPDVIQLHGSEDHERIHALHRRFSLPVIKAVLVRSSDDIARGAAFAGIADMLLFDAKAPATSTLPGGNGIAFDWTLLKSRQFMVPWFLSGGLNLENLEDAVRISGTRAVDVSSSLEIEPGEKDPELIRLFLQKAKAL